MLKTCATVVLLASAALPAIAQTTAAPPATRAPMAATTSGTHDMAGHPNNAATTARPSDHNPVLTDNGGLRTSKIVGSSVYNDQDQKVGSVDDVIIGTDHSLNAVISVGGFLGMGAKMVEVPFDKLQFGNTNANSDNRVLMRGATKASLTSMPNYHYASRD